MIKKKSTLRLNTSQGPFYVAPGGELTIRPNGDNVEVLRGTRLLITQPLRQDTWNGITYGLTFESVPGPGTVFCDRCKEEVGPESPTGEFTSGYYKVSKDLWDRYANAGENHVCDHCMWHDERYRAEYGKLPCSCKKCKCDCQKS
jgi:hypothetical protein